MTGYFDTHAHLNDRAFDADRDALIESMHASGMELCLDVACELCDFEKTLALTGKYPFIYGAYGIHPHYAADPGQNWEAALRLALKDGKAKALGEIGLDYHYGAQIKAEQKALFGYQLELARELDLPVVLHIREAFGDCMDILRANRNGLRGVMHCFSGTVEIARECLDMGLYIAFGGSVTFTNARKVCEAAAYVPADRLLTETDCPYLSPVPHRGERNSPANIPLVLERLAQLRGDDVLTLAARTVENGKTLFGII